MLSRTCLFTLLLIQFKLSYSHQDPILRVVLSAIQKASSDLGFKDFESEISQHIDDFKTWEAKEEAIKNELNASPASTSQPQVRISSGVVIGESVSESHAFYSIPYAKAPVGSLRFMPPVPVEDFGQLDVSVPNYRMCWQIKDCDADEPNCKDPMSEDCLVMNINVPATVDLTDLGASPSDRLPVLVWFHGGFFFRGRATTTKYDGRWLSKAANAVVVTVNYRVGPLGFLTFQDENGYVEGNQGIKDQQLALQWVQDNIEKFGGDKTRVTLFGNSAGSQAVNFHFLSSVSNPLFQRGIIESSPTSFQYQTPQEAMSTITEYLLGAIGCQNNVSCLRTVDPATITDARNVVITKALVSGQWWNAIEPFRPVLDGVEFTDHPINLFRDGQWQSHKEILIGTNNEEMAYISAFFEDIGLPLPKLVFEKLNTFILGDKNGNTINQLYEDRLDVDLSDNLAMEVTDLLFTCPNRALARYAYQTSTHPDKRVYLYNNAYPLSVENCEQIKDLKTLCGHAYHSSEQIFVFKSAQGYETNFTATDALVSDMFSTYWGGFARTGDPSSGLATSLGDFTAWPIYSENSTPPWVNIQITDPQSKEQDKYREKYCDIWEQIAQSMSK